MNKFKTNLAVLLGVLTLALTFIYGCGDLSYQGKLKDNVPPRVFWADIRWETDRSQNPNLRWWSRDIDGQVIDYQYCVLLDSVVQALGGDSAVAANFPSWATWTIVHEDSTTIQLYASYDTSLYVPQDIFLRAMDDDSAFSDIIYTFLRRNNHPPTCYLILPYIDTNGNGRYNPGEPPEPQWCLAETTETWHGIQVAWVGKDSIDVEGLQPHFQWNIRIYGPFTATPDSTDTLAQYLHIEFADSTGTPWIRGERMNLTNLEKGWYILYVRNRDDAFVAAKPAIGFLSVYEPTWVRHPELTKDILIANHSYYVRASRPGEDSIWCLTATDLRDYYADEVRQLYTQLIENAGYGADNYDWVDYTTVIPYRELAVNIEDLYNHRLVIALDTDYSKPLGDGRLQEQETPYSRYLDVGGKVWVIGKRSFDRNQGGRQDFGLTTEHSIAYTHFNLSAICSPAPSLFDFAEFIGAFSIQPDFPDLNVDTTRVAQLSWQSRQIAHVDTFAHPPETTWTNIRYHPFSRALHGVDYLIRENASQTIYRFNSIAPDTSRFHNFPVAIRYDSGTYKTSYFCFPLYFINYDQALVVTRNMLDWFLNDQ